MLNLVGAFLSIEVALTVSNKVVNIQGPDGAPVTELMGMPILTIMFAGSGRRYPLEPDDLAVSVCRPRPRTRCSAG